MFCNLTASIDQVKFHALVFDGLHPDPALLLGDGYYGQIKYFLKRNAIKMNAHDLWARISVTIPGRLLIIGTEHTTGFKLWRDWALADSGYVVACEDGELKNTYDYRQAHGGTFKGGKVIRKLFLSPLILVCV